MWAALRIAMIDEGYVKFDCEWNYGPAPEGIDELVLVRNRLYAMGLVGIYESIGIGYGNVSQRIVGTNQFVISGTATGGISAADAQHFCVVTQSDVARNHVRCIGPVAASSESLTHAMLYACAPDIHAVLHVHHRKFWEHLLETAPCTSEEVAYGTPAMALEMKRLLLESGNPETAIFAMQGHEEGIIAFGPSLESSMLKLVEEFVKNIG
jgi:L-ribulose-5-phosphate 4-epimerase